MPGYELQLQPIFKQIIHIDISFDRIMLIVAKRFIASLINKFDIYAVSTDSGTWYHQYCQFLKLRHHLYSSFEKSIIEKTMQYLKDRTDNLMIIFYIEEKRNTN